jgi:transcriptional regulator with XRE-family HTH domain
MDVRRVVGKNVRRYRIEAGLSQDELAGMGVEEGYVGRLERGGKNPTIVTICHAAEALGVGPAAFSIQAIKTNCEADKGYKDTLGNMSLGSRSHFSSDFMQLLGRPCEPPAACGGRLRPENPRARSPRNRRAHRFRRQTLRSPRWVSGEHPFFSCHATQRRQTLPLGRHCLPRQCQGNQMHSRPTDCEQIGQQARLGVHDCGQWLGRPAEWCEEKAGRARRSGCACRNQSVDVRHLRCPFDIGSEGNEQPRPTERGCLGAQYSSASMIVITRLVTDGSAGSGEW